MSYPGLSSDLPGLLMAYEDGRMSDEQIIKFFQHLIDSGMAWHLQGAYGRQADALIKAGICTPPERKES